jgi:hypothetical protein
MNEAPVQRTKLDDLADKLHAALRRETKDIIEIGKLLIQSHELVGHGHWMGWLEEHKKRFDLSHRSATRYISAARYTELKLATVANLEMANLENLAPSVLYFLAEGRYSAKEEAAILAATREGRVDIERAETIIEEATADDKDDQDGSSDAEDAGDAADEQDGSSDDDDDQRGGCGDQSNFGRGSSGSTASSADQAPT